MREQGGGLGRGVHATFDVSNTCWVSALNAILTWPAPTERMPCIHPGGYLRGRSEREVSPAAASRCERKQPRALSLRRSCCLCSRHPPGPPAKNVARAAWQQHLDPLPSSSWRHGQVAGGAQADAQDRLPGRAGPAGHVWQQGHMRRAESISEHTAPPVSMGIDQQKRASPKTPWSSKWACKPSAPGAR